MLIQVFLSGPYRQLPCYFDDIFHDLIVVYNYISILSKSLIYNYQLNRF